MAHQDKICKKQHFAELVAVSLLGVRAGRFDRASHPLEDLGGMMCGLHAC